MERGPIARLELITFLTPGENDSEPILPCLVEAQPWLSTSTATYAQRMIE